MYLKRIFEDIEINQHIRYAFYIMKKAYPKSYLYFLELENSPLKFIENKDMDLLITLLMYLNHKLSNIAYQRTLLSLKIPKKKRDYYIDILYERNEKYEDLWQNLNAKDVLIDKALEEKMKKSQKDTFIKLSKEIDMISDLKTCLKLVKKLHQTMEHSFDVMINFIKQYNRNQETYPMPKI